MTGSFISYDGTPVTVTFVAMSGRIRGLRQRVEEVSRGGLDGHEFQFMGQGAPPQVLRTYQSVTTEALAEALARYYEAMVGTLQAVTRTTATWPYVMIENVEAIWLACGVNAGLTAPSDRYLVQADWLLRLTGRTA